MKTQRGAALLLAMLTVALVATIASAALWQQWRSAEVEAAERRRLQASWILVGALDWARLILREDGRSNQNSGASDHLGEPWATPLEEARLSSFLAADKNNSAEELMPAFLSGEMIDMQSRLNFRNLVKFTVPGQSQNPNPNPNPGSNPGAETQTKPEISTADMAAFTRLFALLNLPPAELTAAAADLLRTIEQAANDPEPSDSPLVPQRYAQLRWLGLSERTLAVLQPHVTVLPERTPLNINTASAEALSASVEGLDLALAQQVVSSRATTPFTELATAIARIPGATDKTLTRQTHDVRSRFFEIRARLRLDDTLIEERSLIQRSGLTTQVRWRERVPAS
jgi:general secretion pathway protein K